MEHENPTPSEHLDVLVIGAGLSGIGVARHLLAHRRDERIALFEGRGATGGTWDLFRYPGVRSDSDMHTLGYSFAPWTRPESIARGADVLAYLRESADRSGVTPLVRLHHRVVRAEWLEEDSHWRVTVEVGDPAAGPTTRAVVSAGWLVDAAGYFRHDRGHRPTWPGEELYRGVVVHPQTWPDGLEVAGHTVLVIGSGATAVTLVPALLDPDCSPSGPAAHVTMLQRTPTYVMSRPRVTRGAVLTRRLLGASRGHALLRRRNVALAHWFWTWCRRNPDAARLRLRRDARRALPPGIDVDLHFAPPYDPWDQRLCFVPDGDLFRALASGDAEIVTDEVATFTPTGVRLASGRHLEADVVVTATGLELQFAGGVELVVDSRPVDPSTLVVHRGSMLSGLPNFTFVQGHSNASWTLRIDVVARRLCALRDHLRAHALVDVRPLAPPGTGGRAGTTLTSGYVRRAAGTAPTYGDTFPWAPSQGHAADLLEESDAPLLDRHLHFTPASARRHLEEAS